jgi:hypothetical protein
MKKTGAIKMHENSMKLMKYFRDNYLKDISEATIIDIGAKRVRRSHNTYRRIFRPPFQYTGMDIEEGLNVDIVGYKNIKQTYDVLISGQVMEHVQQPWKWLKSLTKYYNQYICIIAPNTCREHRYPIDTYRYFPDGMKDLFEYAKIPVIEVFKSGDDTIGIGGK